MTTTADDPEAMALPGLSCGSLRAAAEDLREAARAAASAMAGAPLVAGGWEGSAADAYEQWQSEIDTRLFQAVSVASSAAVALRDVADATDTSIARITDARDQLRRAYWTERMSPDPLTGSSAADVERDTAWAAYEAADRAQARAEHEADTRLRAFLGQVPDRPRSISAHVGDGVDTFLDTVVVEPVTTLWGLTGTLFSDEGQWEANLSGAVNAWLETARGLRDRPLRTGIHLGAETIGWQYWREGAIGAGVGVVAGNAIPSRGASILARAPEGQSFLLSSLSAELPLHEGPGHAMQRHVGVDDSYLRDRVTTGVMIDGRIQTSYRASRFTDLSTAERAVTRTLQEHRAEIGRAIAAGEATPDNWFVVRTTMPRPVGVSVSAKAPDTFVPATVVVVKVAVDRRTGRFYIGTAYPEPAKSVSTTKELP